MLFRGAQTLAKLLIFLLGTHGASTMERPKAEEKILPRPLDGAIETRNCAFYNFLEHTSQCNGSNNSNCTKTVESEECAAVGVGRSNFCYVLWLDDVTKGETTLYLKGCFISTIACELPSKCVRHSTKLPLVHCCCEGDMCNADMIFPTLADAVTTLPSAYRPATPLPVPDRREGFIAHINNTLMTVYSFWTNYSSP